MSFIFVRIVFFYSVFFFQSFRGKWQPSAQPPIGFFCINNNNWPFTRSGTGSDNNSMNNDSHTRTHTNVLSLTRTGNEITQCAQCVLSLPRQVRLILWPPLSGLSNRARAIIIELALCCSCYVISCRGCNNNNNNRTPATTTTRAQLQQTKKKLETAAAKCSSQFAYGLNKNNISTKLHTCIIYIANIFINPIYLISKSAIEND